MEKYLSAIEALKSAREELAKSGTVLSWELITVNKSNNQAETCISGSMEDRRAVADTSS